MLKQFLIGVTLLGVSLFVTGPVLAESILDSGALGDAGGAATYNTTNDIGVVIGNIIKVVLGLLGIIFLVLTIYAGFLWMTAAGNEKSVAKAKGILVSAIIGLVIVLTAYTVTEFIVGNLVVATQI